MNCPRCGGELYEYICKECSLDIKSDALYYLGLEKDEYIQSLGEYINDVQSDEFAAMEDKEAVKWYKLSAEQGYADAQNNLGIMYRNGYGVEKDDKEAVKWYRLSAEQGNARGQNNLGFMYFYGYGVNQDYGEAAMWYKLSAEQGYVDAQNNLGFMYRNGYGVEKDDKEAIKWYELSAEQGNAWGTDNLLVMCQKSDEERDKACFEKWYKQCAENGDGDATTQCCLGFMYENGYGVEQDYNEAIKWYKLSAEQGDEEAYERLKELRRQGYDVDRIQTVKEWKTLSEETQRKKYAENCFKFAQKYYINKDYKQAFENYRKSAEFGNKAECLGTCYFFGIGVKKDEEEAKKWFRASNSPNLSDSFLSGEKNIQCSIKNIVKVLGIKQVMICTFEWICLLIFFLNMLSQVTWFNNKLSIFVPYMQCMYLVSYGLFSCYYCYILFTDRFLYNEYLLLSHFGGVYFIFDIFIVIGIFLYFSFLMTIFTNSYNIHYDIQWYFQVALGLLSFFLCFKNLLSSCKENKKTLNYSLYYQIKNYNSIMEVSAKKSLMLFLMVVGLTLIGFMILIISKDIWEEEKGHPRAQYYLGEKYYNGSGVEKDYKEAFKWYYYSAQQGEADAQNKLGIMYEKGYGVEQDYVEAVKWYKLSAEQGNEYSQGRLEELRQKGYDVD